MTTTTIDGAGSAHHEIERVSRDDVLAVAGDASGKALTGQQWAALWLAAAVFTLILVTLVADLVILFRHLPAEPPPPAQLTAANVESYRLVSEHYTAMANAAQDRATRLFETCIAACLLPMFAGIVGFIFGREHA